MFKRMVLLLLCVALMAGVMPLSAVSATAYGFRQSGDYSSGDPAFCFITEESILVYEGSAWYDPDYGEIYPGSVLYVPIFCSDDDAYYDDIATMAQINRSNVTVSYSSEPGDRFIKSVSIVNAGESISREFEYNGAHARVEFADTFAEPNGTIMSMQLVLAFNKITQVETRVSMRGRFYNRTEEIKGSSVFNAELPTAFRSRVYAGDATFDLGDGVRYTGRVKIGGYYYLNLNRDEIKSITDQYKKAHMEFYTFEGNYKTFESTGRLVIPVKEDDFRPKKKEDPQIYVYQINGTTLQALEGNQVSYNQDTEAITINTNRPMSYVLSNQPLMREVEEEPGVLRSGYADDGNNEPTSGGGSSGASGSTAPNTSNSNSVQETAPTEAQEVKDTGTQDVATQNPTTGGEILYAANAGTENPSTRDLVSPAALLAVCGMVLAALPWLWKRAFLVQQS